MYKYIYVCLYIKNTCIYRCIRVCIKHELRRCDRRQHVPRLLAERARPIREIAIYICTCTHPYINIDVYREKDRERVNIDICKERKRERERKS